jgi:PD-(D/E)XK endonuclease
MRRSRRLSPRARDWIVARDRRCPDLSDSCYLVRPLARVLPVPSSALLNKKAKGDLAELKVATDLVSRGYKIAFPFGEDWDYDLIVCRGETLERVQVKYAESNGDFILVRCFSHSLTSGQVRGTKHYTAALIDWLAVWDRHVDRCFYIPAQELGTGRAHLHLRLRPSRNGQVQRIRYAEDYASI